MSDSNLITTLAGSLIGFGILILLALVAIVGILFPFIVNNHLRKLRESAQRIEGQLYILQRLTDERTAPRRAEEPRMMKE